MGQIGYLFNLQLFFNGWDAFLVTPKLAMVNDQGKVSDEQLRLPGSTPPVKRQRMAAQSAPAHRRRKSTRGKKPRS